jgi:hypothetical protein
MGSRRGVMPLDIDNTRGLVAKVPGRQASGCLRPGCATAGPEASRDRDDTRGIGTPVEARDRVTRLTAGDAAGVVSVRAR